MASVEARCGGGQSRVKNREQPLQHGQACTGVLPGMCRTRRRREAERGRVDAPTCTTDTRRIGDPLAPFYPPRGIGRPGARASPGCGFFSGPFGGSVGSVARCVGGRRGPRGPLRQLPWKLRKKQNSALNRPPNIGSHDLIFVSHLILINSTDQGVSRDIIRALHSTTLGEIADSADTVPMYSVSCISTPHAQSGPCSSSGRSARSG